MNGRTTIFLLACTTGCMAKGEPETDAGEMMVLRSMELAQGDRGVSPGFDLDGVDSTSIDANGCHQDDYESPEGVPGIDNQLSELIPLIDLVGEGALAAFIQNAIDEGRLLVMPRIVESAGTVDLTVQRGEDQPLVGTDGRLLAEQTLALSVDRPVLGRFEGASFDGEVLRAGPFDLNLPIVVFDILYDVHLRDTLLEIRFDEEGVGTGVLSGSSTIEELRAMAKTAGERADIDIVGLLGTILEDVADMERDRTGKCHALSAVATFETVPVYTYE